MLLGGDITQGSCVEELFEARTNSVQAFITEAGLTFGKTQCGDRSNYARTWARLTPLRDDVVVRLKRYIGDVWHRRDD